MSSIDCIIVEDEPLAVKVLQDYISEVSFLNLKGAFKDAIDATDYLREHQVDLIFLDIHLPKLKGMAFLKTLEKNPSRHHHNGLPPIRPGRIRIECDRLPDETH